MREKYYRQDEFIEVCYEESVKKSINRTVKLQSSHRVHKDGVVGVHYNVGAISDSEGYKRAEKNLSRMRPYPFELESGVRHRDKTECKYTNKEIVEISEECMAYLTKNYPDYIYTTYFSQDAQIEGMTNEKGLDYSNTDCAITVNVSFKHKDSKDICDGGFSFSLRKFDQKVFNKMADDYLANFNRYVDFPDEIIIAQQYYGLVGNLIGQLNGERLALKTSLLTGKIGEKIFSDEFTLMHDVSDEETWYSCFWDGDGCTYKDDKILLIDHGKIVTGIADKRDALKYGINHTGTSYMAYSDIPCTGGINGRILRSTKTVKELLNGRYSVIPVMAYGGGFNEKGDYTMPVHSSLLFDGNHIVGKLKPFTMSVSMFDIFGKNYIGVGSDNPIYNDKQILFKVNRGEL